MMCLKLYLSVELLLTLKPRQLRTSITEQMYQMIFCMVSQSQVPAVLAVVIGCNSNKAWT